ncbi:hypothetical protein EMCRGX_G021148, partial [Ephydatia muelleri]
SFKDRSSLCIISPAIGVDGYRRTRMSMFSLLPIPSFSGLRSKAKSTELKRRDSSSNIYSQSLPSTARRFSSYEELGPLFQSLVVVQEAQKGSSLRRHNLHQSVKAKSSSSRDAAGCDELDAKIARIKGQLTRLKSDHMDMNHRVEDLTSSVGQLYQSNKHRVQSPRAPAAVAGRPSSTASSPLSGSSLESIIESANECSAITQQIDDSPRIDCLQNNLGKPRSKSAAQLSVIRNDFSTAVVLARKTSCKSDSVLFEQRNRALADLSKLSAEMH